MADFKNTLTLQGASVHTTLTAYSKTELGTTGQSVIHFNNLASKPTTLAGFGITDALPLSGGTLTGNLNVNGDITAYRGTGETGVIYLNLNRDRYLYWDDIAYRLPGADLYINGVMAVRNTGTWGISITGNAATASVLTGFTNSNSSTHIQGPDALTNNGLGYVTSVALFGQSDGALYAQAYSAAWVHQIYGDYRTGQIAIRGNNGGAWQGWRAVLDSGNVGSYALPLTGGTMSGAITFSNGRKGLIGLYDPTNTQQIFAMGPAYILPAGGSSTNYGGFYGLAWSYNPDYGAAGNNPQSKAGLNHQLLIMSNGVTQTAIGTGIWTSGLITAPRATFSETVSAAESYATSWFRNTVAGNGLYNNATGVHWYSKTSRDYTIASVNASTYPYIVFRAGYEGTVTGYVYSDANGFGLLTTTGGWALKIPPGTANVIVQNDIGCQSMRAEYTVEWGDRSNGTKRWSWYAQDDWSTLWSSVGGSRMHIHQTGTDYQIYGSWRNVSDRRTKQDIADIQITDDEFMKLQPVSFRSIVDVERDQATKMRHGFIAQDVHAIGGVLADVVGEMDDSEHYLGIEYTGLIAPLVRMVQLLMQRVEILENRP